MPLTRDQMKRPALRTETVPMPALGGDVTVRELLLDEKLLNTSQQAADRKPLAGESDDDARTRAGISMVSRVLAWCVVQENGDPLMTRQEWREFGGAHLQEALEAFNAALRLSGFDLAEVEKN